MSAERHAKILIVDDIVPNLQILQSFLNSETFHIFVAHTCEEALKAVKSYDPDLIILNAGMSKSDALEICRRIKAVDGMNFTPIILVTAADEYKSKVSGLEAGADDFIGSPFNEIELLTRVRSLLRVKVLHDQLQEKIAQLERVKERLKELAVTDGLTSMYNYRFFKETLTMEIRRAERHKTALSLIMFDIDDFKLYNDRHGHLAGDKVLQQLGSLVMKNIRRIDVAARYGGEEFAVILPGTTAENARFVAEKLRGLVENHPFPMRETQPNGRITISVGVASYSPALRTFEALVGCADKRLYIAKAKGKNQVVFEGGC